VDRFHHGLLLVVGQYVDPVEFGSFAHPAHGCRMKVTRSCFSSPESFSSKTRLKNSTVSSSVRHRPSCRYGGLSLMPRSVKLLIGPSPGSFRKRSQCRACIWGAGSDRSGG